MGKQNTKEKPKNIGNILFQFTTPECVDQHRGYSWFIGMGIAVLLGVFWGIIEGSVSVVLLSILLGGIYTLTHNKPSNTIEVSFSDIGVQWKDSFFLYQNIAAFWIVWDPGKVEVLHVVVKGNLLKEIIIPINNQDPAKIRDILGYYIPEVEGKSERFRDWIIRKLKL